VGEGVVEYLIFVDDVGVFYFDCSLVFVDVDGYYVVVELWFVVDDLVDFGFVDVGLVG